ncbi:hypothetical protein ACLOJK_015710 [Asimina triloba]
MEYPPGAKDGLPVFLRFHPCQFPSMRRHEEGSWRHLGHVDVDDLNSRPLKVAACCKHYAAYDLDNWLGFDCFDFDAMVTQQDMVETFLRSFEMCVREGDVSSVMCSYNRVDGIPTFADPKLLSQTITGDWGLHGYIFRIQGKVRESDVENALRNLYVAMTLVGYFDGSPAYESLGKDGVCTHETIEMAASRNRFTREQQHHLTFHRAHLQENGFSEYANVDYQIGCADAKCKNESFISQAVEASKETDATIILVGLDLSIEAEGSDRTDLLLPGYQTQLINQIARAAVGPVVLVIMSAGCVDISFARDNPKIGGHLVGRLPWPRGREGGPLLMLSLESTTQVGGDGAHVVMVHQVPPQGYVSMPVKQLVGGDGAHVTLLCHMDSTLSQLEMVMGLFHSHLK